MKVHPQIAEILARRAAGGAQPYAAGTPEQARLTYAAAQAAMPGGRGGEVHAVRDETIDAPQGPVTVRRYRPTAEAAGAAIVYCHGGGWVVGTLDGFDAPCRALCRATDAEVISVDYRLAPEHPFPAGLDDVQAVATAIAAENPSRRLVLMGDSSGANLAAACVLRSRAAGAPLIDLQVLAYPVTDHDLERPSYQTFGKGDFLLSREDMAWFWDCYAPSAEDRLTPFASPLRAQDLTGLPPALVIIAGFDPLRDEGAAYAAALEAAGVPVTVRVYEDMIHGFLTLTGLLETADTAMAETGRAIVERLSEPQVVTASSA